MLDTFIRLVTTFPKDALHSSDDIHSHLLLQFFEAHPTLSFSLEQAETFFPRLATWLASQEDPLEKHVLAAACWQQYFSAIFTIPLSSISKQACIPLALLYQDCPQKFVGFLLWLLQEEEYTQEIADSQLLQTLSGIHLLTYRFPEESTSTFLAIDETIRICSDYVRQLNKLRELTLRYKAHKALPPYNDSASINDSFQRHTAQRLARFNHPVEDRTWNYCKKNGHFDALKDAAIKTSIATGGIESVAALQDPFDASIKRLLHCSIYTQNNVLYKQITQKYPLSAEVIHDHLNNAISTDNNAVVLFICQQENHHPLLYASALRWAAIAEKWALVQQLITPPADTSPEKIMAESLVLLLAAKTNYQHVLETILPRGFLESSVAYRNRLFYSVATSKTRLGAYGLQYVALKNDTALQHLLTEFPEALLYRGNITLPSGQHCKNTTAFELILRLPEYQALASVIINALPRNATGYTLAKTLKHQAEALGKKSTDLDQLLDILFESLASQPSQCTPPGPSQHTHMRQA